MEKDEKEEIFRFSLLYKPLGLQKEGLNRYCHYLRRHCSVECERIHKVQEKDTRTQIGKEKNLHYRQIIILHHHAIIHTL